MATVQAVFGNLTAVERGILTAINTGASSLSLVGSSFIVLCYLSFKELRGGLCHGVNREGVKFYNDLINLLLSQGVVGIAAAVLLGSRVTVTDLPHVLPNLQFNVDANASALELHGGAVEVAVLPWGEVQQMDGVGRDYDVILGSDVVYHDHLYEPLLKTLRHYLLESGKEVVFFMAHLKKWKKEFVFF